ncbi:MAG: hypothetical protein HYS81_05215 [Candidatus Aenigmatarchaeota archaeon]|nr:MAG: hypothetical protein HYS81_05215 [Candidatus Aenigmarchaeota archaeon]
MALPAIVWLLVTAVNLIVEVLAAVIAFNMSRKVKGDLLRKMFITFGIIILLNTAADFSTYLVFQVPSIQAAAAAASSPHSDFVVVFRLLSNLALVYMMTRFEEFKKQFTFG